MSGNPWKVAVVAVRAAVRERTDLMACAGTDPDGVRGLARGRDQMAAEILRIVDDAIAEALEADHAPD